MMASYAAPQAEAVATRVDPAPSRSMPPPGHPPPNSAPPATSVAHVPLSAVLSNVHHHPPLQPNRHHPMPDNSWHDHHSRLKGTHIPPPPQHPHHQSHHVKVEKSPSPNSQSPHLSHRTGRAPERASHTRDPVPESTHSYHTVNVVSPHPAGSRMTTPTHHASYLYPVHQLVAPVAHVPIGAAHYAHLPPSIWSPPHAQYHQHAHAQHQLPPPSHHVSPTVLSAPHGQVQYATSHVHHVPAQGHPPAHAYAIPPPYTTTAPQHAPPPGPPHAMHPSSHHPQHHITYAYAQMPAPPPHHPVKTTVAVSPSQPLTIGGPVSYSVPASHSPQSMGPPISSKVAGKTESLPVHVSHADHVHSANPNGVVTSGAMVKPYTVRDVRAEPHRLAHGTETRTDTSPPRHVKDPALSRDRAQSFAKAPEQRKDASQKDKSRLPAGQVIRKPRKPYTMKKSREVWTPEEHNRFLQALQLYDRDWKKIETYIGTKTVLQIRSHAQKYFGKVTKYKTGEYIPPPRPKKRAALPYPRSRTSGQSKSSSGNGSASDKPSVEENGGYRARDQSDLTIMKPRTSATQDPPDSKQSSPSLNSGPNGTAHGIAVDSADNTSKPSVRKPSHTEAVDVTKRRSDPATYADKYSPTPYDGQNNKREQFPNHANHAQTSSLPRWHPAPLRKEPGREQHAPCANLTCASSTDTKPGINGYRSDRYAPPQGSSCTEDLQQRQIRDYHRGTRQLIVGSENHFTPRQADRPSPNQTSSMQSFEHDSTSDRPVRKKMAMPNNSLLVLSNCVDLVSRDAVPERQPAAGWATAAAARRAHRAKVIRARKPPLPQGSAATQPEDPETYSQGSPEREQHDANIADEQRHRTNVEGGVKVLLSPTGGQSPQVASPDEYGSAQPSPDPQRSSAGSGTGSDDAIAGFSSSDRPSVSGSAAGSGTGGSPDTSEAGDPEEDPKSSNDGSGDDGRRSPPTRDSSPTDPNSSGSRENSPNEFPLPQSRSDSGSVQLAPLVQKSPEATGISKERFDRQSHGEKNSSERKAHRPEVNLNREAGENGSFPGRLLNEEKLVTGRDGRKSHPMPAPLHTGVQDSKMPALGISSRADQAANMHEHAVQESSPNSKKRLRVTEEYDIHSGTDGRVGEHNRDCDAKRPRVTHPVKEANCNPEPAYQRQDFTERNR